MITFGEYDKIAFTSYTDQSNQARFVAVACRDKNKTSKLKTASPTPSCNSITCIFVLASKFGWEMHQLDLTNAFLNGKIDREKYVAIPQGLDYDPNRVMYQLKKALYRIGYSSSLRLLSPTDRFFSEIIGLKQKPRELCVYTKRTAGKVKIILIFVDDFLLTGNDNNGLKPYRTSTKSRTLVFQKRW